VKRCATIIGIVAGVAILTYAILSHHALSDFEERVAKLEECTAELEFRVMTMRQDANISLALCARMVTATEKRQRSLENVVLSSKSLNLTLESLRTYNADAHVVTSTNHDAIGGGP